VAYFNGVEVFCRRLTKETRICHASSWLFSRHINNIAIDVQYPAPVDPVKGRPVENKGIRNDTGMTRKETGYGTKHEINRYQQLA
jgi:hypothetical protein